MEKEKGKEKRGGGGALTESGRASLKEKKGNKRKSRM